jgi:hypothetical protein
MIMVGWLVMRPPVLYEIFLLYIYIYIKFFLREARLLLKSKGW